MGVQIGNLKMKARKVIDNLTNISIQNSKIIVSNLYDELVENTPKDTGEAMASWNISSNDVTAYSRKNLAVPRSASDAEKAANYSAIRAFQTSLKLQVVEAIGLDGKIRIVITNGARHIRLLEYKGRSEQAPYGWVRRAVRKASRGLLGATVNLE